MATKTKSKKKSKSLVGKYVLLDKWGYHLGDKKYITLAGISQAVLDAVFDGYKASEIVVAKVVKAKIVAPKVEVSVSD